MVQVCTVIRMPLLHDHSDTLPSSHHIPCCIEFKDDEALFVFLHTASQPAFSATAHLYSATDG